MSILIKNCLVGNSRKDIYVEGKTISEISSQISVEADQKIDGKRLAALPSFANAHTHSAMTLFRGYADDMQLMPWLEQKIWPNEARLTEEMVYQGSRLACLEMIKSGTTFFNDMYWHFKGTFKAVKEMGIRSSVNGVFIDLFDPKKAEEQKKESKALFDEFHNSHERIQFSLGPHAIYTVSEESLLWIKEFSEKNDLQVHIHVSETEQEVKDCVKKNGLRPVEYLDKIGFLSERVVAAHCVWLNEKEAKIMAKHDAVIAHNPIANMKLAVGGVFPYSLYKKHGVRMALGTDGTASNNNLSMFDTMKTAALLQKFHQNDPTVLPASECFDLATRSGYACFGLDAGITEGKVADFMLVNTSDPVLSPSHNMVSDMVYAAHAGCVDTVICNGSVLMKNRQVSNEAEIVEEASAAAHELLSS